MTPSSSPSHTLQCIPIHTPLLKNGDDLAQILLSYVTIEDGDIVVISSKAIATVEGAAIDLSTLTPSADAYAWSEKTKRSPAFCECVLQETVRLHGETIGHCPGAILTQLRPDGLIHGTILAANAGMDESNIAKNFAVGWPLDPVASAHSLRTHLSDHYKLQTTNYQLAVLITDSCCVPRRWGVSAYTLALAGLDPLKSEIGHEDLFGKKMRVTVEATADQLAVIANHVMGNAGQSCPAAIIRHHGIPMTDFAGWVRGIEPEEDLFASLL